ncbi:nucleotidyltransferase family protein [Stygiobacter electus]|uniref:NTP transferase domain-containing protein n=1 Tax=Stygiobacter electus TaxID=3032292 RepID=A0AAE3TDB3_9BACT|nr:NTP transferase domain-containing protein [Stygiobacter electus]MDF1612780.1 NTP transferase domain-containing protein [Stygiobacter electus]
MKRSIDALLISAGYSGRMGDFKPLLKIKDKTFLQIIIEKLLLVCNKVVVVTGYRNDEIEKEIENMKLKNPILFGFVTCVYNENYHNGMFTSIQKGIQSLENSNWVLFHFVDQPLIPNDFYIELVNQVDNNYDWIQPVFNFTNGHPVVFRNTIFDKVISAPFNFKMQLIRDDDSVKKKFWISSYPEILHDFDTKEDFTNFFENQ